jgi:DNA polymerase III epsilon subunit-like protein
MIYCSLDLETTGLNVVSDRPIEYGGVLYSTSQKKCLDNLGMLIKTDLPITPEITRLTGITKPALDRFGYDPSEVIPLVIEMIANSDAVIGYNNRRFDYHILKEWAKREGSKLPEKPWIDLFYDMPWQVPVGKLSHVAADHGILNLFPHSALADSQTVLAIAAKYDDKFLLERSQSPIVVLRSHQSRIENEKVKQAPYKFRWNGDKKIWWKPVKQQDVDAIIQSAPFSISVEKDYTVEELDN